MATKLYPRTLVSSVLTPEVHRGTNTANAAGTAIGWQPILLSTFPGGSVTSLTASSVTGPTNGVEAGANEWISLPLAADVTISGAITFNLWGLESSMTANAGFQVIVERLDSQLAIASTVVNSEFGTELGTSSAVNNWTAPSPTSTAFSRGDRIRVRVLFNDAGGTMGSGFTLTFNADGGTGGANGDSWIQFTETLTFENADPTNGLVSQATAGTVAATFGDNTIEAEIEQGFVATASTLEEIGVRLKKLNAPTDNVIIELRTSTGTVPTSTVVATLATIAGTDLTTSFVDYVFSGLGVTGLTVGSRYHVVMRRSGSIDASNLYQAHRTSGAAGGFNVANVYNSGTTAWGSSGGTLGPFYVKGVEPTTYYLTDTAESINPGSATEKKALTTRGSGSTTAVTNTAAGYTAPIQVTASGGGTAVEWYTPPLNAFTMGGKTKFNIRGLESSASANASFRAEIAITDTDGSGPTVWGAADIAPSLQSASSTGEVATTDSPYTAYVSGGDVAVTNGQRLRFRIYVDDLSSSAMATSFTATLSYNGASAAAAGDTYVTLPQFITDYIAPFEGVPYVGGGYYS